MTATTESKRGVRSLLPAVRRFAVASFVRGAPAGSQGDQKGVPHHAFNVRGLVESGLPTMVFVLCFRIVGTRPAAVVALAVAALLVVERLARRKRVQEALSGVFGVLLAVALAAGTGDAKNFFLPEVVLGFVAAAVLGVSLFMGRPLLGVVLGSVAPPFRNWRDRPVLRRAFAHITAVAAIWAAVKATILLSLYLTDDVELLAGAKLALGYPALGLLVAYYFRVVKRALVREAATLGDVKVVPA